MEQQKIDHHKFFKRHKVYVENPHPQSYAAYIKYKKFLFSKTEDFKIKFKKLAFRDKVFRKLQEYLPEFHCEYCGASKLDPFVKNRNKLATLDHIHPISKDGEIFNLENLTVACYKCNCSKGSKSVDEFLSKFNFRYSRDKKLITVKELLPENEIINFR
jgi:hypothetical protein